ncbi:hydrolase [Pseudomonadota bacterium]|nr:hydrolase [Pseudomonadota bacterium]
MAHRHSKLLNFSDSVFIMIDMQQRLVSAMPDDIAIATVKNTQRVLTAATTLEIPTMVTEQYPQGLGATVAELAELIEPKKVIEKTSFSCAKVPEFMKRLDEMGRKQVVLAGMESHICVLQTALDFLAQGFHVHVVEDAICSRDSKNKANAIHRMRDLGVNITNMESVLFEWLADAAHPQFKALSKLVI